MFTFNDWLKMEIVGRKAIHAARVFAQGDEAKYLDNLEQALAEIRIAASQLAEAPDRLGHELSNPATRAVMRDNNESAIYRLREKLFKRG